MLSKRSKILVVVASVIGLFSLVDYIGDISSWQKEPSLQYWYQEWIFAGASISLAGISVLLDFRRNR
jgi:hypothetical protein